MSNTTDTKRPYGQKIQSVFKVHKKNKIVNDYTSGATGSLASGDFPSST